MDPHQFIDLRDSMVKYKGLVFPTFIDSLVRKHQLRDFQLFPISVTKNSLSRGKFEHKKPA